MKINREEMIYESKKVLGCLIGVFIYSVGINLFVVPAIYYVINIPILLLAMVKVGKKFLLKTLIASTAMTVFWQLYR